MSEIQTKKTLSDYRMNLANEKLQSAQLLYENGLYRDSIGRSYYAIFSATRALLAMDGVDFKKHSGVISYFQKTYIKTELLPYECSDILMKAFQIRNQSDYEDMFIASKEDAREQSEKAKVFIDIIKQYLINRGD